MSSIIIRPLVLTELARLSEIDVSEKVSVSYRIADGKLESFQCQSERPVWSESDWVRQVEEWQHDLLPDLWLGAFDGDRLVGAASLRYRLTDTMAQLTTLHIDKAHRRQGVARHLMDEVKRLARESGAMSIYISATESESAVGFYLSQRFVPTDQPHPKLFELEPEDIHMICPLSD